MREFYQKAQLIAVIFSTGGETNRVEIGNIENGLVKDVNNSKKTSNV